MIYLKKSNRKALKLVQYQVSIRRHVSKLSVSFITLKIPYYLELILLFFSSLCFCFCLVQKPEEGSISQRVQRLAKYRFLKVKLLLSLILLVLNHLLVHLIITHILNSELQKQSDLLLNADDLDAMWVCLRENCVIDDATGAEKVYILSHHNLPLF